MAPRSPNCSMRASGCRRAPASAAGFTDITYHHSNDGRIARIAFDRPEVRNAFRPHTVDELYRALDDARTNPRIGVVLLTGNGPSAKDGGWAFCSGGDQRIRGRDGYKYSDDETGSSGEPARRGALGRLHILEVQRLIRFMPKVVIAVVPGLGGRRRALAARRLRPHHRERASTAGSSRRMPTSAASTPATARPTSPARSGRSSRARCSSSPRSTPPSAPTRWAP